MVPLLAAMFRLVCSGYMANGYWQALEHHLPKHPLLHVYSHDATLSSVIASISTAQIASIQQDLKASSDYLLGVAVEDILRFMFNDAEDSLGYSQLFNPSFFDALQWALPKVGPSPTIELYAIEISQTIRQMRFGIGTNPGFLRVVDCLDQYTIRIQNTRLAQLEPRIENGALTDD